MYTISQFAKLIGVSKKTLHRWDESDRLKPIKLESGHRRYNETHLQQVMNDKIQVDKINVIYCRESTKQQKQSLENQIEKCKMFCLNKGLNIDRVIEDYGSGLNYNRNGLKELVRLISSNQVDSLVIYYKDRLVRFGYELIQQLCLMHGVNIIIIDDSESNKTKEQEFADDLISIIHHFSMKLYGSRIYMSKIKKAEENILDIKSEIVKG